MLAQNLTREMKKLWNMVAVIGAVKINLKCLTNSLEELEIKKKSKSPRQQYYENQQRACWSSEYI